MSGGAVQELLAVLGDLLEETLEPDASGPPEPPYEISRETMVRLLDARARFRATALYTRHDLDCALEGARTKTRDEVVEEVVTKIVAYVRRQAAAWDTGPLADRVDASGVLEGLAEELCDGEWRREGGRS